MRHSLMIVAAVCSVAVLSSPSRSLAVPNDAGSIYASETPDVVGTCETGDQQQVRQSVEFKDSAGRVFQATRDMTLRADIDGNGEITLEDLVLLLGAWGNCPVWSELSCQGDLNQDNVVDYNDLSIMMSLLDMPNIQISEVLVKDPEIVIVIGESSTKGQ